MDNSHDRGTSDHDDRLDSTLESESDGVRETSFQTASAGTDSDASLGKHEAEKGATPSSSRYMPVPDCLDPRYEHLRRQTARADVENGTDAPPAYDDAVTHPDEYHVHNQQDRGGHATGVSTPPEHDSQLSAEEMAVVMAMRDERESYLPSPERRSSLLEAIELDNKPKPVELDQNNQDTDQADGAANNSHSFMEPRRTSIREEPIQAARHDNVESASPESRRDVGTDPVSRFREFLRRQPPGRVLLFVSLVILVLSLILFVSLFPASFVYLEYHQIALKQSKMTGVVDRDTVYYGGSHILGPDTTFVRFQSTSHDIVKEMSVFTKDTISVIIRYSVHYFIRPEEVGELYTLFYLDYEDIIELMIHAEIRTLAGTTLTLDDFRFARTSVENSMHNAVRRKLGGDCCPSCCRSQNCQYMNYCSTCKHSGTCDKGYHIDVRFFNLLSVAIPEEVFERYLHSVILGVEKEKEFFIQAHTLTVKETERMTQKIKNEAYEIVNAGKSRAEKIAVKAAAEKEKKVQLSKITAYKNLYAKYNMTNEEYKLSLMLVQSLGENVDNLYAIYGYEQHTFYDGA